MSAIEIFVRNIFGVWTGAVTPEEHVVGAVMMFLPWVLLAHVGHAATGVKELEKLRNLLLGAAIIVALGPVAIPAGLAFMTYRYFFSPSKAGKKSPPSTTQV